MGLCLVCRSVKSERSKHPLDRRVDLDQLPVLLADLRLLDPLQVLHDPPVSRLVQQPRLRELLYEPPRQRGKGSDPDGGVKVVE